MLIAVIIFIYYIFVWFRVGKDTRKGPVIPLYEPPPELSPAAIRYIMNMGYDKKTNKKDSDKHLSAEELKMNGQSSLKMLLIQA